MSTNSATNEANAAPAAANGTAPFPAVSAKRSSEIRSNRQIRGALASNDRRWIALAAATRAADGWTVAHLAHRAAFRNGSDDQVDLGIGGFIDQARNCWARRSRDDLAASATSGLRDEHRHSAPEAIIAFGGGHDYWVELRRLLIMQ
ncbi:hypothetical protein O7A70_30435 [Mesorhizobium sp. Cs1299R1N1]|uniref:hypothetical protein n=1 Tax=Mesorhizobium sp. Cs1299R1N1 TaxID=3015172 RepID=UPI00301C6609